MSHPQAIHTSCRAGLGGISGFQMHAASPALSRDQLASLSEAHARYDTPHDLPYEPTPEQMRDFPVALKMSVVPAVGPVVSRTEYVGREYRGRDGQPDEGRFGNYFCHMVVGESGPDPFGGLAAIELWDASHWTTIEADDLALSELAALTPGPLDVGEVLSALQAAPAELAQSVLEGAMAAVAGGKPLLIVDPVPNRAATWLAWITYALPTAQARALTFSTFEGRPQDILNLHVIVTTPACDTGPAATGRFNRIDVASGPFIESPGLYARTAWALAGAGPEALAGAVRQVAGGTPAAQGASLAIAGNLTSLVTDAELASVLEQLGRLTADGHVGRAAEAASALTTSEAGDRQAVSQWADLYLQARLSSAGDPARDLAAVSLARIVDHLDVLGPDLPRVSTQAPAAPGVAGIGAWIRAAEATKGTDRSGTMVDYGLRLGLIGLNRLVDTRVAALVVADFERSSMRAALAAIEAEGTLDHVIEQVTTLVAETESGDSRKRARLVALSGSLVAQQTMRRRAQELGTFDSHADWQHMRVAQDPSARIEAARTLVEMAVDDGARAEIRELWGAGGPQTDADLNQLLLAYLEAECPVPAADRERAFRLLMAHPLPRKEPPASCIGFTLAKLPEEQRRRTEFYAWAAGFKRPVGTPTSLINWSKGAAYALTASEQEVPDERWQELLSIVGQTLIRERHELAFPEALTAFGNVGPAPFYMELGRALGRQVELAEDRPMFVAHEFAHWMALRQPDAVETSLPIAFESLSQREFEDVRMLVTQSLVPEWDAWLERHPRDGARRKMVKALGRLVRDRGDDR